MRYLITGGAGFIGSNLSIKLLEDENNYVTILDDISTGSLENLVSLKGHERVEIHEGSILNSELLESLISKSDMIFHLAAAVGVQYINDNPLHTLNTNVKGTELVLETSAKYNCKIMIFSTSEVYGKSSNKFFSEEDDRIMGSTSIPRWGYATSKALDEFFAFAYHREKNLPVILVRLFNTVGIHQTHSYGMVIPRFIKQAMSNEKITVFGDGQQSRCFCNVKDVIRAIILLSKEEKTVGQLFNIGSTEEITILQLAQKIISISNSQSEIEFIPHKEVFGDLFEDMHRRVPDIQKINKFVGFKPEISMEETLQELINLKKS